MKRKVVAVLTALTLCTGSGIASAAVGPPGVNGPGLTAVGPVSASDGFPVWYKDKTGLRLENCLDITDPLCPPLPPPNTLAPISFPDNYPDEAFYTRTAATMDTPRGTSLVEMQLEQAFASDVAIDGDQITFARVRYRVDVDPFATVKVTSPVGVKTLVADDRGRITDTEDIGIGSPGDFTGALGGRIGPFLTWDTYPTDPALKPVLGKDTYVGDPGILHKIKGSAYDINFFRIEGIGINPGTIDACPTVAGPVGDCIETDLFTVQGKLATISGVTVDQATYSRSSAAGGFVDVFASSEPDGQQAIEVTDVSPAPAVPSFNPTGLRGSVASAGHYFAHVPYTGAQPPTKIQVSNTGDVPVSNKIANVVDRISGTAVYTTGFGDAPGSLAINALSSDKVAPRVLTASGFAAQPLDLVAGALTVPSLDAPPVTVTVASDAGGTVKLQVEIIDGAPIPALANAGPDQIVAPGQQVTLDGSASTGTALAYSWTSVAGIAFSDPVVVNPTFTAPALPGIYPIDLTVTGLAGVSTATVTITVAHAPTAPVMGTVTAGDTTAMVNWTAPADAGGSPITGYDVQMVDAFGLQIGELLPAAASATSLEVTGLTNGTSVRFQVRASNAAATGAYSDPPSAEVTPTGPPSAPAIVTATAGDTTATVTWTAPADGGSPLTGYDVRVADAVTDVQVGALLPAAAGATSLEVTGLVNGTALKFQVRASNALGTGAFSALSGAVTPDVVPDAPVIGTATAADASATITWAAPANRGSAITGYNVQVIDAAGQQVGAVRTAAADATSLVIIDLANGTEVRFQVQASNAAGTGAFSALSNPVTPVTVPAAPVIATATAGNASATVTWTAPADGGSPLTGYDIRVADAVTDVQVGALLPAAAGATSLEVTGLVNGTALKFQVRASNALGTGAFSTLSGAVTPDVVPDAPVIGTATAADASATITWAAPANRGSAITGYNVQVIDAAGQQVGAVRTAAADATSLVIIDLANGTEVRFQVQASNAAGTGAFSALSNPVTPATVPAAPVIATATAGNTTATVTWTAPADGGSPITGYTVRVVDAAGLQVGALRPAAADATSLVVTGLVNGTAVRFQVQASNAAGTGAFSALSNPVTATPPAAAVSRLSDFNRDGYTDLVARDNAGTLWLYPGNGTGGLLPRKSMGTGWQVFTAIVTPGDVTGDGVGDVLARDSVGRLRLYPGNGAGGLAVSRVIGNGWRIFTAITAAGDLTGDGRSDVLARDTAGNLWLYPMVGDGAFQARRRIGTGWNVMTAITGPGDFSGDGNADILARDNVGQLWLYRGNGAGAVSARTRIGTNWQGMTALVSPGNWDRAGGNDLLARDSAGSLWLYPGNNAGGFTPRRQIGTGWRGYTI